MRLLAEGMTSRETARVLQISIRTVEAHRINISRKMSFSSIADLVRYAIEVLDRRDAGRREKRARGTGEAECPANTQGDRQNDGERNRGAKPVPPHSAALQRLGIPHQGASHDNRQSSAVSKAATQS